jgi:lysophospholipase L1-like esterase
MNKTTIKIISGIILASGIFMPGFLAHRPDNAAASKVVLAGSEQQTKSAYSYLDNPQYAEKTSHFSVYSKKGNIVMLGNSITARVDWSELLNRNDIVNRGIGSDITEGFLNRMEFIYAVKPKICYIMGGINDIARKVPQETIVGNIGKIIQGLREHKIQPVLQSVLYVADSYPNYAEMNSKVESLNNSLEKTAKEYGIPFLNLNEVLSSGKLLIKEYCLKDGIHLNGSGYERWKKLLIANLKEYSL